MSKKRKTSLIVTHMNQKHHPDGHSEEFLTEVDGVKLTSANYVFLDLLYLLKLFFLNVQDSGSTTVDNGLNFLNFRQLLHTLSV
ncbi:MAG TPA: hypothetical protein VFZ02_11445 [Ktedonobacteraceae bacterium]